MWLKFTTNACSDSSQHIHTCRVGGGRQRSSYDLHVEWAVEIMDAGIVCRLSEGIRDMFTTAMLMADKTINDANLLSKSECSLLKSFNSELNPNVRIG